MKNAARSFNNTAVVTLLVAYGVSACSSGTDRSERCLTNHGEGVATEVQLSDSAGVTIISTPCVMAFEPLEWRVDPSPTFDVGGNEETYFSRLSSAVGVPSGGVVALDVAPPRLLFFPSSEHSPEVLAAEGDGPGEIRGPVLVHRVSSDSVLVFDRRSRRFTEWVDLENRRFELHNAPWLAHQPLGEVANSILVEEYVTDFSLSEPGLHRESLIFSWWSMADGSRRAILETDFERSFTWIAQSGRPTVGHLPYAAYPRASIHPDGAVVSLGDAFEVLQFDTLGALRRIFRTPARRLPVDEQAISSLRRSLAETPRGSMSSDMVGTMPLPDSIATFRSLLVDRLGWTWAELESIDPGGRSTWLVFDRTGVARGTVELPPRIIPFEIRDEDLLAVWADSLGVERLQRFRLERGGSVGVEGGALRD
jgi:hypothetical protein